MLINVKMCGAGYTVEIGLNKSGAPSGTGKQPPAAGSITDGAHPVVRGQPGCQFGNILFTVVGKNGLGCER